MEITCSGQGNLSFLGQGGGHDDGINVDYDWMDFVVIHLGSDPCETRATTFISSRNTCKGNWPPLLGTNWFSRIFSLYVALVDSTISVYPITDSVTYPVGGRTHFVTCAYAFSYFFSNWPSSPRLFVGTSTTGRDNTMYRWCGEIDWITHFASFRQRSFKCSRGGVQLLDEGARATKARWARQSREGFEA